MWKELSAQIWLIASTSGERCHCAGSWEVWQCCGNVTVIGNCNWM